MGCYPLLPARLSYPEILPKQFHEECIYGSPKDLVEKLTRLLTERRYPGTAEMSAAMARYSWDCLVPGYDALFEEIMMSGGEKG